MKKIKLTWKDVNELVDTLEIRIKKSKIKLSSLYGVPRGGLVVAVILSHRLNLPLTDKIKLSTLVVDDISDSGKTLIKLEKKIKEGMFSATLVCKEESKYYPDFSGIYVDTKNWIVFPWETNKSSKRDNI